MNYQLRTTNCQLPTANYQLRTTNYQLTLTTNYQLPTANYQLPTVNCELPTANYQLRTTNCARTMERHSRQKYMTESSSIIDHCQSVCRSSPIDLSIIANRFVDHTPSPFNFHMEHNYVQFCFVAPATLLICFNGK